MPVKSYFGGKGEEVLKKMKEKYGDKKGEEVFYATVAKKHSVKSKKKD